MLKHDLNFPIAIIDNDYNSLQMSGILIRQLAQEIETQGVKVIGGFSVEDAEQTVLTYSEVSAVLISLEGSEEGPEQFEKLHRLIKHIHRRNNELPVFLLGERQSIDRLPTDLLPEIRGIIYLYEDTKRFLAKQIVRAASEYIDQLLPPFFKALLKHTEDSNYSWHTPGHAGGVAFTKDPVGLAFHQFFGENTLRSDLSVSVPELGSLMDHSGPVKDAENEAAENFGADMTYFVTNGTSTANKIVWHGIATQGDVVFVDRNCHKSLLHALIMTGATPVYFQPSRNAFGIIGPIAREQFTPEHMAARMAEHPLIDQVPERARMAVVTNSTYDGICYHANEIKRTVSDAVDYLHFDEAWYAYAAFHPFYKNHFGMANVDDQDIGPAVFTTQSTHKLLAAFSQASMIHVKQGARSKVDPNRFNEAFMMHTSTSPHYGVIASCDVASKMMSGKSGPSLIEDIHSEAMAFRHSMANVGHGQESWWFDVWQPDAISAKSNDEPQAPQVEDWVLRPGDKWHGFKDLADNYVLIDPIKVTLVTPGLSIDGFMAEEGIPAAIVSQFLWERGIVVEKTGLYSFLVLFSLGITKGKWSTLLTELLQFKRLYDTNANVESALPTLVSKYPDVYTHMTLRTLCQNLHTFYRDHKTPEAMNNVYTELPDIVMTPAQAYHKLVAGEVELVSIDELEGRIAAEMIVPYPPGIPLIMPGERYNKKCQPIIDYLAMAREQSTQVPGFEAEIHGLSVNECNKEVTYAVSVLKK
ncbi:lysine decarboxylase [Colwellia sp. Arc7-635]|uniref:Orn/Lys/Arg family decarboxylase n=1 Tax=Colwellia sp. Arc7-635 TaxID=2497879 RepID=UPI000F855D0F|nr:Orn/Lys/Arg decarboxylase N-terminal domain-containing protein [Colwellia sp. Arc7-635]AZQ84412.1 lysine decarboxylase [Colwellia sp. Arc7-635]